MKPRPGPDPTGTTASQRHRVWRRAAEHYLATPSRAYEAYRVLDAAGLAAHWPDFVRTMARKARERTTTLLAR